MGVSGTTSEEALDKIERPVVIKEGKAGHEINGGGNSGNNVVKKVVVKVMETLMAGMMQYVQHEVATRRVCGHLHPGNRRGLKKGLRVLNRHQKQQNIAWDVLPSKRMRRIEI